MTLNAPDLFINRELSWLRFNSRVLSESTREDLPILERLKFIAIYATNLDEFYMVRVASLQEMYKRRLNPKSADGLTTNEVLRTVRKYLHHEQVHLEKSLRDIQQELTKKRLVVKNYMDLTARQRRLADDFFTSHLYPVIIPIAVDATHPFPHMNNLSFSLVIKLEDLDSGKTRFGLIRIPRVLPRFFNIKNTFIPIETIILAHIEEIFLGFTLLSFTSIRITRNADMFIEEEEASDYMELLEQGIRSRRRGTLVRLEIGKNSDPDLLDFITNHLPVNPDDIYTKTTLQNHGAFWEIVGHKNFTHLMHKNYTPKILPPFYGSENIFKALKKQDVLLFMPYESFDPVVNFILEATSDPEVLAIKITLYRVGANSPIVKALIEAANEGKQITAIVELKARFDEANNLKWAKRLEQAGAHVIYGIVGLKIHAKIALVVKQSSEGVNRYVHLSTGNYNPSTAKLYSDFSFFTSDETIASDATRFFHQITGFSKQRPLDKLITAPDYMKPAILQLIEQEESHGENGCIIAKVNALVDPDVITALYKASRAGVQISLLVRGICCLRPGVEGVSENIEVISIVGKYLEHVRAFYFHNNTPQIFFSSADWMPRNLLQRIEILTPINDPEIAQSILDYLEVQLSDNVQAKKMQQNGEYKEVENNLSPVNSQHLMEKYFNKASDAIRKNQKIRSKVNSKLLKGN
jgi:polyphosphate kinase